MISKNIFIIFTPLLVFIYQYLNDGVSFYTIYQLRESLKHKKITLRKVLLVEIIERLKFI